MHHHYITRRTLISAGTLALAGCATSPDPTDEAATPETDTVTPTAEGDTTGEDAAADSTAEASAASGNFLVALILQSVLYGYRTSHTSTSR